MLPPLRALCLQMPSMAKRTGKDVTERKPGEAYKDGRCITFTLTLGVALDTLQGEVRGLGHLSCVLSWRMVCHGSSCMTAAVTHERAAAGHQCRIGLAPFEL